MQQMLNLFSEQFSGRLSRKNYFLSFVLWPVPFVVLFLLFWLQSVVEVIFGITGDNGLSTTAEMFYAIAMLILSILAVVFSIGVHVRRLHDRNHSGWWVLILSIPLLNFLFALYLVLAPSVEPNRFGTPDKTLSVRKTIGLTV